MNRFKNTKVIVAVILFSLTALLLAVGLQQYKVLTDSRATVNITPTVTIALSPTITTPSTIMIGSSAGYIDIPEVQDDSYTPPLPLDQVTAEMKQAASAHGGLCNIDTKECKGWAWKFVCTVDADVVWNSKPESKWNNEDLNMFYNRHCTKETGTQSDVDVKFEQMFSPANENQVYKLDDVGCGKLVQVDVTVGNCEPDGKINSCRAIRDALVYYTGSCPLPTPTVTLLPTDTPTPTLTPSVTPTGTLTPSPTPTITLTPTITATPTPTSTPTPTATPVPTSTVTPTPTPTTVLIATYTPQPTYVPQPTYTPQPIYVAEVLPTATPVTKLVVNNQPPGSTPWLFISIPFGLILLGLLL